jgi:hypothetical protein
MITAKANNAELVMHIYTCNYCGDSYVSDNANSLPAGHGEGLCRPAVPLTDAQDECALYMLITMRTDCAH